jgi:hypothetical protein
MQYFLINVLVVFEDPEIARAMEGRWREGSSVVDDLTFRSYFFSTNENKVKSYLALKLQETEDRWKEPDDLDALEDA